MRTKFILTVLGLIILYGGISYYIGLRFLQAVAVYSAFDLVTYYWFVFGAVASTYFIGRISAIYFPGDISDKMIKAGSYWLAMTFYLCLLWLLYDVAIIIGRFSGVLSESRSPYSLMIGLIILTAATAIVIYGERQACRTRVRHYDISINKKTNHCNELHIVLISDLHLGLLIGRKRLAAAVRMINELNADLVLLAGDIIDENIGAFVENQMPEILREIQAPLGIFGILGSHEYIYGHSEKALRYLKRSGITILRDSYIQLGSGVYIVGRDDLFREQLIGTPRRTLSEILQHCNRDCPIILLDHQPVGLTEAKEQGVDLQLSGHTHHGQIFPLNLVIKRLFPMDWGYLRKGAYQLIVSSGYGTWGPPIRVGTVSEIVDITIKFSSL